MGHAPSAKGSPLRQGRTSCVAPAPVRQGRKISSLGSVARNVTPVDCVDTLRRVEGADPALTRSAKSQSLSPSCALKCLHLPVRLSFAPYGLADAKHSIEFIGVLPVAVQQGITRAGPKDLKRCVAGVPGSLSAAGTEETSSRKRSWTLSLRAKSQLRPVTSAPRLRP